MGQRSIFLGLAAERGRRRIGITFEPLQQVARAFQLGLELGRRIGLAEQLLDKATAVMIGRQAFADGRQFVTELDYVSRAFAQLLAEGPDAVPDRPGRAGAAMRIGCRMQGAALCIAQRGFEIAFQSRNILLRLEAQERRRVEAVGRGRAVCLRPGALDALDQLLVRLEVAFDHRLVRDDLPHQVACIAGGDLKTFADGVDGDAGQEAAAEREQARRELGELAAGDPGGITDIRDLGRSPCSSIAYGGHIVRRALALVGCLLQTTAGSVEVGIVPFDAPDFLACLLGRLAEILDLPPGLLQRLFGAGAVALDDEREAHRHRPAPFSASRAAISIVWTPASRSVVNSIPRALQATAAPA